jgi:hypothetical protein
MIKVSVMYANEEGKEFDMDYYCKKPYADGIGKNL